MTTISQPLQTADGRLAVKTAKKVPRLMTLAEFRRRYSDRKDGFKYEFNKGIVEKTLRKMKMHQYHIVNNISRRFTKTAAYASGDALASEVERLKARLVHRRRRVAVVLILRRRSSAGDCHGASVPHWGSSGRGRQNGQTLHHRA